MEDEMEQIIRNLKACLVSVKGGIPLPCLDRDFKVLIGHSIPFRKLGFDSLEQFLRSIPDVSISKKNGETIVAVLPSKNTEHLASLVARQKSAPKKVRAPVRMGPRRTAAQHWRPPPTFMRPPKPVKRNFTSPRPHLSVTFSQGQSISRPPRQVDLFYEQKHHYTCDFGAGEENLVRCDNEKYNPQYHEIAVNQEPSASPRETNSNTYEKPPRFMRMPSREGMANNSGMSVEPQSMMPRISIPSVNENAYPPLQSPVVDGIQSIAELEAQVHQLSLNSNQPSSALQARLQKLQVPSVFPLADHFVTTLPRISEEPDYEKELRELTRSLGLGLPVYTAVPRFPKGEPVMYNCKVKVGEESYTSYPDEDRMPAVALQRAAQNALKELRKRYELDGGHAFPTTQNPEIIKARVSELVASHTAGIWSFQVPLDYRNKWMENLPIQWLDVVRNCSQISVDIGANNRIILNKQVISPAPELDNNTTSSVWPHVHSKVVPEPITYPSEEVWDVYVTCALTTADVWVRLIGEDYNVRYENMSADMEIHYMDNAVQAVNPEVGNYYAIKLDDCWHRVEFVEMQGGDNAVVFFLDHGDEDAVPLTMLHVLEPKYAKLPAQAIQVVLSGLEEFAEDLNATNHLVNTVIGKTLVAQVVSKPTPEDPEAVISVLLYDTSTDEDVDMNRLLAERIIQKDQKEKNIDACEDDDGCDKNDENKKIFGLARSLNILIINHFQKLLSNKKEQDMHRSLERGIRLEKKKNGVVTEVFVSHVSEGGEIFLNIKSESFNYLQSLMEKLMEGGISDIHIARASNHSSNPTKLYLARYSVDCEYYRAIIINEPDENNWAIKVSLHSVPPEAFGPKFVERFRELVKEDEPVLVKVVKSGTENMSSEVEMFKRTEDKQFISINNTLALDPELVKPKQANENRLRRRHISRAHPFDIGQGDHQRGLGVPQIPDVGQYFDVHVTMAANPSNFTVQPYKERISLEELMGKMQDYYNNHIRTPVSPDNVKEGGLFAALHNDENWYRVTVSNVIGGSTVSVYFCDFGDVAFLPLDRLQPLSNQFKSLPAQAIKAKLARIMPSHGDWSVEDCIRFQERVVEKQFVSVIVDSGPDLLNPSDIVIGLQLYDTSGNVDIEIDSLLVDEKRAVFTPAVQQQLQQVQQIG
ncbi:Tudor domain-containing protein 7 [Gryllus bimaculatus]|nr:Tudor domain-containing protein 7 [Gryllus bimaculatus]